MLSFNLAHITCRKESVGTPGIHDKLPGPATLQNLGSQGVHCWPEFGYVLRVPISHDL